MRKIGKTKLNLGCGSDIRPDYINLDIIKNAGVDVVHDLEKFPYPFEDNTFTEILCNHILEHMNNLNKTIDELWRITKKDGIIKIWAPYALGPIFFGDPSHKTPICYRTFENYNIDNPNIKFYLTNFNSPARFKILKRKIIFSEHAKIKGVRILKFMDYVINLFPRIYERFFCYILPSEMIYIELKVIK
ncbi:MAG: methyltransferase domain-containing protein [Candidatus Woesearchaeota archaeon]